MALPWLSLGQGLAAADVRNCIRRHFLGWSTATPPPRCSGNGTPLPQQAAPAAEVASGPAAAAQQAAAAWRVAVSQLPGAEACADAPLGSLEAETAPTAAAKLRARSRSKSAAPEEAAGLTPSAAAADVAAGVALPQTQVEPAAPTSANDSEPAAAAGDGCSGSSVRLSLELPSESTYVERSATLAELESPCSPTSSLSSPGSRQGSQPASGGGANRGRRRHCRAADEGGRSDGGAPSPDSGRPAAGDNGEAASPRKGASASPPKSPSKRAGARPAFGESPVMFAVCNRDAASPPHVDGRAGLSEQD